MELTWIMDAREQIGQTVVSFDHQGLFDATEQSAANRLHANTETTSMSARADEAHLAQMISLAPAPCRLLQVEVFENEGESGPRFSVGWIEVVGLLCLVETEYVQRRLPGEDYPRCGVTHKEMSELGWKASYPGNRLPIVWPVLLGGNDNSEYALRIAHERDAVSNVRYSAIVRADWAETEDRDNAVRIGKELVAKEGNRMNWADLP